METINVQQGKHLVIMVLDVVLLFTAYIMSFVAIEELKWEALLRSMPWLVGIAVFFISMYELNGTKRKATGTIFRKVLITGGFICVVTLVAAVSLPVLELSAAVIVLASIIWAVAAFGWRVLLQSATRPKTMTILFIGEKAQQAMIMPQLQVAFGRKAEIRHVAAGQSAIQVFQLLAEVDCVVIGSNVTSKVKSKLIYHAIETNKMLYVVPEFAELLFAHSRVLTMDDTMVIGIRPIGLSWSQRVLKRLFDVVVSATVLVVLSPLFLVIMLWIKWQERGAYVIYKQPRLGKHHQEFTIYKFRSMVMGAEKLTGPVLAEEDDPRITRLGQFLRKTRIDELPQFWNVLKGDMSIVGPRPERAFFIKQFEKQHRTYVYRSTVKPGITGYAQIMGKYTTNVEDKLRFDLFYISNYSFLLDVQIQFRTLLVLLDQTKSAGQKKSLVLPDVQVEEKV